MYLSKSKRKSNNYEELKRFLNHVCKYHDATFTIYNDSIYIYGDSSTFMVQIPGRLDYHKQYRFMHKNEFKNDWHLQGIYKIKYGLFLMASHDYNNKYHIPLPTMEDLHRFIDDYEKLRKYNLSLRYNKRKHIP